MEEDERAIMGLVAIVGFVLLYYVISCWFRAGLLHHHWVGEDWFISASFAGSGLVY